MGIGTLKINNTISCSPQEECKEVRTKFMKNKKMLNTSTEERKKFEKGAKRLKKEAKKNGFKTNAVGLQTFLDNCELDQETDRFYRVCILYS